MKLSFIENKEFQDDFYPFLIFRKMEDLLTGVFSNRQRWKFIFDILLGEKVELVEDREKADYIIDPRVIPTMKLAQFLMADNSDILYNDQKIILSKKEGQRVFTGDLILLKSKIDYLCRSLKVIEADIKLVSPISDVTTVVKDKHTKIYNPDQCYVGKGFTTHNATLNAERGPIYIGENVNISEYAVIHGPVIIHENSNIGPHSFIRGGTVIGPYSNVSGELKNVLFLGNTNKGHFGYLGDSIIGEYCNLGAGTSTSNMKNNFSEVKIFDKATGKIHRTKNKKIGSFIGDFSCTAVNTVLKTGTTIGTGVNLFGSVTYPKHVPDFSWGVNGTYRIKELLETAKELMLNKGTNSEVIHDIIDKLEKYYNS